MDRNLQLEKIISEYRSIVLAKNHLYRLGLQLETEQANLKELEEILEKEYEDLEKFKETSVRKLFHKVLKSREEQFEIERQEYLQAVLQFKDCENLIELLVFERGVLEEKVSKEKLIKQQLDSLISQRNLMVSQKYAGFKNTMISLNQQLDEKLSYKREIHEALIVALKATEVFRKMIELIKKAKSQGGWGMKNYHKINTKDGEKSFIDEAHLMSYQVKQILQKLEKELEDVYEHKSIQRLNRMEDFKHFNEIYHNRLISDWIVKNKIASAVNYLKGTKDTLTRIVKTLKIQLEMTTKGIDYINDRKQKVINENLDKY